MERVVIFGTGNHYKNHKNLLHKEWEIIAFTDNNPNKINTRFQEKLVISPEKLIDEIIYDKIVIASKFKDQIIKQLIDMGIPVEKITLLNCYRLADQNKVKIAVEPDGSVIYKIEKIIIICKTRSDFNVVQEVFDEGSYNYVNKKDQCIVIDIGMNTAITALYFAQNENISKIFSFEPFPETYRQGLANISLNKEELKNKIVTYNYGLDLGNSMKHFNYNESFSEGISTVGGGLTKSDTTVEIEVRDAGNELEPIIKNNKDKKIILKIDCEGSEYEIFESLDRQGSFHLIDVFMVEYHVWARNKELERLLLKYEYHYILLPGNDERGFLYAFR